MSASPTHLDADEAPRGAAMVYRQAVALLDANNIPREPAMRVLTALAGDALAGPHRGRRRFSAINQDGFPFQWSASLGKARSGLRFIVDCGIPGTSISERITHTLQAIGAIAFESNLADAMIPLRESLAHLLPNAAVLEASLMGLCVGVDVDARGMTLKIYVNTETGEPADRLQRVSDCLVSMGRPMAAQALQTIQAELGDRLRPAFTALDLGPDGIGRLKLYFRPTEGSPELAARAAEVAGCPDATLQLAPLHLAMLSGSAYPAGVVDLSIEFPRDGLPVGYKVDLYTAPFLSDDREVDRRICALLSMLDFDQTPYRTLRDIVAGPLRSDRVSSLLFVGLAIRAAKRSVNVYLHPCPDPSTS